MILLCTKNIPVTNSGLPFLYETIVECLSGNRMHVLLLICWVNLERGFGFYIVNMFIVSNFRSYPV
jgi:hypothetical protein